MNLASTIEAYGTSQGAEHAWDTRGRGRKEQLSNKAQRARAAYVPCTAEKQRLADESEKLISAIIHGQRTADNAPFDIIKGKNGIEVKTIFPGVKNDKITIHPESRMRKEEFARKNKIEMHTVVVDRRTNEIHYAPGVKSYRLGIGRIKKVSVKELTEIFK